MTLTNPDGVVVSLGRLLDTSVAFVETADLDMGNPQQKKSVLRVLARLSPSTGLEGMTVQFRYRNSLDKPLVDTAKFVIGSAGAVKVRVPMARFIRIKFEDSSVRTQWFLAGFELMGIFGGRRF